jgi:hypothetical protein
LAAVALRLLLADVALWSSACHQGLVYGQDIIPGGEGGIAVLGDLLVGLLGGGRDALLDGLADVVDGVLDSLHCEGRGWLLVLWVESV